MVEQIQSIDVRAHRAKCIAEAPRAVLDEVLSIPDACLYGTSQPSAALNCFTMLYRKMLVQSRRG